MSSLPSLHSADDVTRSKENHSRMSTVRFSFLRSFGLSISIGCALAIATLVLAIHRFGSLGGILGAVRGDPFVVTPGTIRFNHAPIGSQQAFTVTVTNLLSKPIRIVGAQTSCSCLSVQELPVPIPPHEKKTISLKLVVRAPENRQSVNFFADDGSVEVRHVEVIAYGEGSSSTK